MEKNRKISLVTLKNNEKLVLKVVSKEEGKIASLLKTIDYMYLANIFSVCDVGEECLIAEEFVLGYSLDYILRKKEYEFTINEILMIGIQMCKALNRLHKTTPPVIHGDIKPENIILCSRNPILVKLIDCDDGVVWDQYGVYRNTKGTYGFCAPEQRDGKMIDTSTDIYGLGKTLEFLLYGSKGHILKKRHLKRIIKKGTAQNQKDRFVTVTEFQKELETILYGC